MSRLRPSRRHLLRSHPSPPPLNRLRRRLRQHRLRQHLQRQHHLQRIQSRRARPGHRHLRLHPVRPLRLAVSPQLRPELLGNPRLLHQARPLHVAPRLPAAVWRPPRKRPRPRCLLTTLRLPSRLRRRKSLRPRHRRLHRRRLQPYPWQCNLQYQHRYRRPPRPYLARRRTDFGTRLSPVTSRQCEGLSPATST
jgi:hypothetical protein